MSPNNLRYQYSEALAKYNFGHAVPIPVSSNEMRIGQCGYFDDTETWNPIVQITDSEEVVAAGFVPMDATALKGLSVHRTEAEWGPLTSDTVIAYDPKLDVGAAIPGVPVEASIQFEVSNESSFGAVLTTEKPVIQEYYYRYESPWKDWIKNNSKIPDLLIVDISDVFSPPTESDKPYLLFLHGFPDSSYGWANQIEYFTRHGYGVIAPDMLGYGGTDSPDDLESYRLKSINSEIVELLDCEGVDRVVATGHDFGTAILSTLHYYNPDRLLALAYLTLGYTAPGANLRLAEIEALNNQTNSLFGYPIFGYFIYHITEEAAAAYDDHLDSAYSLWFTNNATYQKEHLAPLDELERWLSEDRKAPYGGVYITDVVREQWKAIVRAQGGLAGGLRWYKSLLSGVNQDDAAALQSVSPIITKPTLVVTSNRDPVCLPSITLNNTLPYAPFARPRTLDSGHFVQLEKVDELNYELHEFVKSLA